MSILSSGCNFIQHLLTYFTLTGMLVLILSPAPSWFFYRLAVHIPIDLVRHAIAALPSCACAGVLSHFSRVCLFATPWIVVPQATLSIEFSGKNTGVGSHFLLWEIFLTQWLVPDLPHWQAHSLPLVPPGCLSPGSHSCQISVNPACLRF